jgi:RND family efflux transporter MFP subunit
MNAETPTPESPRQENQEQKIWRDVPRNHLLRFGLPLLILAVAGLAGFALLKSGPQAKPMPVQRNAMLVEVRPVSLQTHTPAIEGMGTVQPAQMVALTPQISGAVLQMADGLAPGGILSRGQVLIEIDPQDYQLAVRQLRSEVARVEADLRIEQGNQLVARQEYALLGEQVSAEELSLMLRQPQLENLQAVLDAARSRLAQAELDLERAKVVAPFDAIVVSRDVSVGSRVSETTSMATLVGIDEYWIEALVPVSQLRWIKVPLQPGETGSAVRIYDQAAWGDGRFREGEILRLAAGLEEQGRMARLLVSVKDPLALHGKKGQPPRLLLNSYVRVEIEGEPLPLSAAIDRAYLRENDRVWILTDDNRLDIRPVEIVHRGREQIYVTGGLQAGEQLVVSDIPAPVADMVLRIKGVDARDAGQDRTAADASLENRTGS